MIYSDNSDQPELIEDETNISTNRLNYSLAVARKKIEFVSSRKNKYECSGKDAFELKIGFAIITKKPFFDEIIRIKNEVHKVCGFFIPDYNQRNSGRSYG